MFAPSASVTVHNGTLTLVPGFCPALTLNPCPPIVGPPTQVTVTATQSGALTNPTITGDTCTGAGYAPAAPTPVGMNAVSFVETGGPPGAMAGSCLLTISGVGGMSAILTVNYGP